MPELKELTCNGVMDHRQLVCPVCGSEYVHFLEGVEYETACDADYDFWRGLGGERGGGIRIPMYCEDGDTFTVCLAQHKGFVYAYTARFGKRAENESSFDEVPIDLYDNKPPYLKSIRPLEYVTRNWPKYKENRKQCVMPGDTVYSLRGAMTVKSVEVDETGWTLHGELKKPYIIDQGGTDGAATGSYANAEEFIEHAQDEWTEI